MAGSKVSLVHYRGCIERGQHEWQTIIFFVQWVIRNLYSIVVTLDLQRLQLLQKRCLGSDLLDLGQLQSLPGSLLLLELVDLLELFRDVADLLFRLGHLSC